MKWMLVVAATVAVVAGCGGDPRRQEPPPAAAPAATTQQESPGSPVAADPEAVHVHGLGIDGDTLLVATHNGLYRLGADEARPQLVGETRHDLMGFTVAAPDRLLASGHPDLRGMREDDLPHHLGLMESRDGGEMWQSVSLLGEADFHVLRAAGERVYGFDATHRRLLASEDGGGSWNDREAPGVLFDLVLDPDDPDHLLAAGERGLQRSRDGGRSWELGGEAVGLLAWPDGGPLYLVDAAGSIMISTDGDSWLSAGGIGGQPAAFLAAGQQELYVALHGGAVKHSDDGGESWSVRLAPAS